MAVTVYTSEVFASEEKPVFDDGEETEPSVDSAELSDAGDEFLVPTVVDV